MVELYKERPEGTSIARALFPTWLGDYRSVSEALAAAEREGPGSYIVTGSGSDSRVYARLVLYPEQVAPTTLYVDDPDERTSEPRPAWCDRIVMGTEDETELN